MNLTHKFPPRILVLSAILFGFFTGGSAWAKSEALSGKVSIFSEKGKAAEDRSGVVVFLEEVNQNQGFAASAEDPRMASKEMRFVPEILPILAGSTVKFSNEDDMVHNVYSLSKAKPFDLGLLKGGEEKGVTFDRPGLVRVYCNIHEGMKAYILVLGNPYFTRTDPQGRFTLKDVPFGSYNLVAWYRSGEGTSKETIWTAEKNIRVGAESGSSQEVNFEIVEKRKTSSHKNKWGLDYKSDY